MKGILEKFWKNMMKTKDKILKLINEFPGLTLKELSVILLQTKGNISIHLKNLEKNGFIKKYTDDNAKKKFRLHPTKKGKESYLKMKLKVLI